MGASVILGTSTGRGEGHGILDVLRSYGWKYGVDELGWCLIRCKLVIGVRSQIGEEYGSSGIGRRLSFIEDFFPGRAESFGLSNFLHWGGADESLEKRLLSSNIEILR